MSYKKSGNPLSSGTHTTPIRKGTNTGGYVANAIKQATSGIGKATKSAAASSNKSIAKTQATNTLYNSVVNSIARPVQQYNSAASALANQWSNTAQQQAATYNQSTMDAANAANQSYLQQQMDYNRQAAADANAFNQAMWQQTANYNSAEAQINRNFQAQQAQIQREWQEKMASQAIQIQMRDLKAAGVNPILAASYGGANFGSGAAASGSTAQMSGMSAATANAGLASSPMASISGFQGIMENTSSELAKWGLIAQVIGNAMDAFTGLLKNPSTTDATASIIDAMDTIDHSHEFGWDDFTGKEKYEQGGLWEWLKYQLNPFNGGFAQTMYNQNSYANYVGNQINRRK